MGLLLLALVIALLVLGLERNARRTRRQTPTLPGTAQPHERRDRDAERLLDELRAQA
ncbi:hypothetical protein [Streptacidiphilus neutrinimicus]|uniref:hypothetical protein n=1 Tax=Streptacidiphilus neutrinimicus TaxID=105420 RepID=UPI000A91F719|nr:hypothetical protein [Streptacidiphilus neutrinimicus]